MEENQELYEQAQNAIIKLGNPILKSKALKVENFDEGLLRQARELAEIMRASFGIGLAAPQIGKSLRLITYFRSVGEGAYQLRLMVNPEVQESSEKVATDIEGCLSIPGIELMIERPVAVKASYQDLNGEAQAEDLQEMEARVVQHEIDHLDGILILDRAEKYERKLAMRALLAGESYSPRDAESSGTS